MAPQTSFLSFSDWVKANPSIIPEERFDFYRKYLKVQLIDKPMEELEVESTATVELYRGFLRRLTVIYRDDPEIKELKDLDFDDDRQVLAAIPIFAEKIRDISTYYKKARKYLKKSKERYSMKGSEVGVINSVESLFFNKYSTDGDYFDPTINDATLVGELEDRRVVQKRLNIEVQEIFAI